jgi:hypothetical protein
MGEEKSDPDVTREGSKEDVRAGGDAMTKGPQSPEPSDKQSKRSVKDFSIPIDPPDNQGGAWR